MAAVFPSSLYRQQEPVLIMCGEFDSIVIRDELMVDASLALGGAERMTFQTVEGGHDFPILKSKQVVNLILDFWHLDH